MYSKKLLFIVGSCAIVAALLTMYVQKHRQMGYCAAGSLCDVQPGFMGDETMPMMRESDPSATVESMGMAVSRPTSIESDAGWGRVGTMDYALDVAERVYSRTASQGVVVESVPEYMRQLREFILSNGGVILNSNQSTTPEYQYAYISAKIPTGKLDETIMLGANAAKTVINESIDSLDVTGQQVAYTEKLNALEEQKAAAATELAAAPTEAERTRIQARIDQLNKQIEQQKNAQERFTEQVQYATLNITAADSQRFFMPYQSGDLRDELEKAWKSLQGTGKVVIQFLIWVAVYAVIWLPLLLGAKWLTRYFRSR